MLEAVESYFLCSLHARSPALHILEGTHRFDEPVSNTTLNDCAGVPMVMGP